MTSEEVRRRIEEDPDFIYSKRFEYSLSKLIERYPDGCPPRVLASCLLMTEGDVEAAYERIVAKLQKELCCEKPTGGL